MGNVLFDKHMSVRRNAALHDLWSPVASTAEARIVPARAAAHGRVTESIDLIAAYPQVVLGSIHQTLHTNSRVLETCDATEERERSSRDVVMSFAGVAHGSRSSGVTCVVA